MTNVKWKSYKSYSGPVIVGDRVVEAPTGEQALKHVERAYWLTTAVETGGKVGSIMAADGTAMTAGLDQHIAVYPRELAKKEDGNAKNDQGSLWQLMRRLETVSGDDSYQEAVDCLWGMLKAMGWYISQDGYLRYLEADTVQLKGKKAPVKAGDLVFGYSIREAFTPGGGKVPQKGAAWEQAKNWAIAFHDVTVNESGVRAQVAFGCEHLVERTRRNPLYEQAYEQEMSAIVLGKEGWTEEMDLAMAMCQAHSVNAPAIAKKLLAQALRRYNPNKPGDFARHLIRLLGTSSYGRWDDDIQYGRYQRTRSAARKSGLWSRSLFDGSTAIMPKDLPG